MVDKKVLEFVKKSQWFSNLPEEVSRQIADKLTRHSLKKDDVLIRKGDMGDSVFMIRSGWVKIVIPDEVEGDLVVNHVGPGEYVGELSLVDQKPRSANVVALSDLEAYEFKRDDFLAVLNENPMLGLYVVINISSRMRFLLTYIEKSIQWSHKIAEGDYEFMKQEMESEKDSSIIDNTRTDDARASRFLAAFFEMVEGIQQREEMLMEKVYNLSIQIDEDKRDEELAGLINSSFFKRLEDQRKELKSKTKKK
ncbi:MAG: cyclic nucleotide-binding domain-containing protein [Anaerolineae bacterium]|nr:cyclic nucleotide-binding domain-containing protein [Anaerolineae bacterium]